MGSQNCWELEITKKPAKKHIQTAQTPLFWRVQSLILRVYLKVHLAIRFQRKKKIKKPTPWQSGNLEGVPL